MTYPIELLRAPGSLSKDDLNRSFVYVVHLGGNFVMEIGDELHLLLMTIVQGGGRHIAFEMGGLKYIDSTGIGILINVTKQLRAKGGDAVLLNVNPRILEILKVVKLPDFLKVFLSEKQVAEHFFRA